MYAIFSYVFSEFLTYDCAKSSSQNNLCIFLIVHLDFRDRYRQPKSQSIICCLVYFVADTKWINHSEMRKTSNQFHYFTNWIRKSSSFIPISKYFSVKCLKS